MTAIQKQSDSFPVLAGDIKKDTESIIGELAVGTVVVERGLARLYLVWRSKAFLSLTAKECKCNSCGLEFQWGGDEVCPKCGGTILYQEVPMYPTLNDYVGYISEETGKSRQTIFNRLRIYRVLCDERDVSPISVFDLNLLSPGAVRKLAAANEDDDKVTLKDDSWQATVDAALELDNKSMALEYVKYDVLHRPRITVERDGESYFVHREFDGGGEQFTVEKYELNLSGQWNDSMIEWLDKKLGAKTY